MYHSYIICSLCVLVKLSEAISSYANSPSITESKVTKGPQDSVPSGLPKVNNSSETDEVPGIAKVSKNLGEKCSHLFDCSRADAICSFGVCACPPGYYEYHSSRQEPADCREKKKFNETCARNNDCKAHDANSVCSYNKCTCSTYTVFIKHGYSEGKCYEMGKPKGASCEISEQCNVPDGYKCHCAGQCHCTSVEVDQSPIKIENILIGVFAAMAILIGLQVITLLVRKRCKASQQQEHPLDFEILGGERELPSAPAEDVYPQITSLHPHLSSRAAPILPCGNHHATGVPEMNGLPPSYDDVCSILPPAFKDVKQKGLI